MAAPTLTARVTPAGKKNRDGHASFIAFALDPDVSLWEKQVGLPAVEGGDPIDQTTMWNEFWRTSFPRSLATLEPFTIRVAYDPAVYDQIVALINRNGSVTAHLSDGSTATFYGYLKRFAPDNQSEGTQPEADIEVVPTNFDDVNDVEEGPVFVETPGTA